MGQSSTSGQQKNANDLLIRIILFVAGVIGAAAATYFQYITGNIIFTVTIAVLSAISGFGSLLFSVSSFSFDNFFQGLLNLIKKHKKNILGFMGVLLLMSLTSLLTWR